MDSSDDEGIIVKKKSLRTKIGLLDSDEDGDEGQPKPSFTLVKDDLCSTDSFDDKRDHHNSEAVSETPTFSRVKLLDSDNEEKQSSFNFLKKSDLYDAEESDEDENTRHHNSEIKKSVKSNILNGDDDEVQHSFSSLKNNDLYDADESGDEEKNNYENLEDLSEIRKAYKSNKRSQSERKSKAKAVQQIHSESQRLIRESRVSLPYHRPRQRTLAEFLQRRQSTPSSVKLSSDNIGQVWKQLEERAKNAEQFYKSDSDDESAEVHTSSTVVDNPIVTINNSEDNPTRIVNDNVNNGTDIINESVDNATKIQHPVSDKPEIEKSSVSDSTACISVNSTDEPGNDANATKTDDLLNVMSNENAFRLDISKSENSNKSLEDSTITTKKIDTNVFITDDNACIDSDVLKVDKNIVEQAESETNEETKVTENTCDFHLHYSESQSVDTQVPWYEKLEPPSPVKEEERVAEKEEKVTDKEVVNQEEIVTDKEKCSAANTRLKKLARKSIPGLGDIAKLKPRLSGAPDDVIELDGDESPGNKGVVQLMQRFIKHSVTKYPSKEKEKVHIGIVRIDSEEIVQKDIVSVTLDGDEAEDDPKVAKPGAKLQKLKEQLQQQISKRRFEEFSRREQEKKEENEELSDCGLFDDVDEMEEHIATETETEEEEEEDELPIVEKKRVKRAFVDDEADVSDDYEPSADEDESDDDDSGVDNRTDSNSTENTESPGGLKDKLSTDVDKKSQSGTEENVEGNQRAELERTKTFDLFMTQEYDDDGIPPYQRPATQKQDPFKEQERTQLEEETSVLFTGTNSENLSLMGHSPVATPAVKLLGTTGSISTQDNLDELVDLCSGQFSESVKDHTESKRDVSHADLEAELVGLCSGKFTTQPSDTSQATNPCSGEFLKDVKGLVDSEKDISHTDLESKLVGLCSGKFSTLADKNTSEVINSEDLCSGTQTEAGEEIIQSFKIISDDEDDDLLEKRTHARRTQLQFSDEESEAESDATEQLVEYDSEENEIPSGRDAKEFFENEAELSESEWDSADEDEQDLDTLEWEEGDAENLDQHQLKEQLNKIHMRRQMDQDQREVRLLQEILLEDGELHSEGGGRERKFRWKNIDNVDDSNLPRRDSDNEGGDDCDIEDEEQWRRARHEREMFLEKQKKEQPDPLLEEDSQLFKLGQAALKRMNSQNSQDQGLSHKPTITDESPDPKHPYKLLTKRGSFLARGESALKKIAELAAESSGLISGPKNSRNFVFARISPEKKNIQTETMQEKKKRMAPPGETPPSAKKPRFGNKHTRGRSLLDLLDQ